MYNGGNQPQQQQFNNGLYVPPAFRRGGGNVGQQRGGPRPNNYGGRLSYDQRNNGGHEDYRQYQPPQNRPNFHQNDHQRGGGPQRQPYAGRFS